MKVSDRDNVVSDSIRFHEETKHHYHLLARSAGYMDWENQPNPFRFYEETKIVKLPLLKKDPPATYPDLYHFTIGRPMEDPRLTNYPAYHHLKIR